MSKFKIALGVCGGIAAYKAVEVMRGLQKAGCEVAVAMTENATQFVAPLTFRAFTQEYTIVNDYDRANPDSIAHINFSQNADLMLIVPATANIIGKFANGIADDFISSTYLASTVPVLIAPAMNVSMWNHPATQRNISRLKQDGVEVIEPIDGELACRTVGTGKLEDVENIVAQVLARLQKGLEKAVEQDLREERLLITVGGTREPIDPVRFISNHSSGKMGFAVAEAAARRGADVKIIAGTTTAPEPSGVKILRALSASEMFDAVMTDLSSATIFVGAAAVADYRPANAPSDKIKKQDADTMMLELVKTKDILDEVSRKRPVGMIVAGFAAETKNVLEYARSKMEKKGLDLVVANDVTKQGAGFNTDTNIASIVTRDKIQELAIMPKIELADKILDAILQIRKEQN